MGHGHSHEGSAHGHSHGDAHGHAHGAGGECGGDAASSGPASAALPGGAGSALLTAKLSGSAGPSLAIRFVAGDGSPMAIRAARLDVDLTDWSGARVLPFLAPEEAAATGASSVFVAQANRMSPEAGPLTLTVSLPLPGGDASITWTDFYPKKHRE